MITVCCTVKLNSVSSECIAEEEEGEADDVDPYELMESVDILAKIPKDFSEKIVSLL